MASRDAIFLFTIDVLDLKGQKPCMHFSLMVRHYLYQVVEIMLNHGMRHIPNKYHDILCWLQFPTTREVGTLIS